jgi:pantothenate kinase
LTIFLVATRIELEQRLVKRWADLGDSDEKARHWVATNDMPNVDRVLVRRKTAHLTLS